jgi:hypothetical protein
MPERSGSAAAQKESEPADSREVAFSYARRMCDASTITQAQSHMQEDSRRRHDYGGMEVIRLRPLNVLHVYQHTNGLNLDTVHNGL